ncbi:hypothetical protein Bca4012_001875 [Brassica carinata]
MATTMKGLLKGLCYITQIFDEEEKELEMQNGFPDRCKACCTYRLRGHHYAKLEHEKGQTGEKELLPTNTNEKPKQKPRRKPGPDASPNHNRSPSSGNAASSVKQSRHNRSKHGSMDSVKDTEASTNHILPDGSAPPRKAASRPRKLKGSIGGEASMMKSSKGKPPESSVDDTSNDII